MKIAQVVNSLYPAGAEKLVVQTSKRYAAKGHHVTIILLKSMDSPLYEGLEKLHGLQVLEVSDGIGMYNPLMIHKLRTALQETQYDIIHSHLFPSFYWAALAKTKMMGAKLIYTEHNTNNRRMNNALYRIIDRFIYKRYDAIITISDSVRHVLEKHLRMGHEKLTTIYNGIDLEAFRNATPLQEDFPGIPKNGRLILQVSAFRPQKDQDTLIRSMLHLEENIHLLFAGDGEKRKACEDLSVELGLGHRVHFLGIRKDIPKLLKTVDVVVLSTHYEGLSLSSVEAMACGKPFIASNVPGVSEVVEGAGVLFKQGDDKELAKKINELLQDPEYYNSVVKKCIARSQKFDIENMTDGYLKLYENLIGSSITHLQSNTQDL